MPDSLTHGHELRVRVLGELEVLIGGTPRALPPSKKTRALLAYLAVTGRPQRRDRLCSIFWEIPDDPRGALRWSLSKLRALVDAPNLPRIQADRDTVSIDLQSVDIDLAAIRQEMATGLDGLPTGRLRTLADRFRGEFLEGLDLPACHDFQAWCGAEREDARVAQLRILDTLVARLLDQPDAALPYARAQVRLDVLNEAARARLISLLAEAGRRDEAERQHELGRRLLDESGIARSGELDRAVRASRSSASPVSAENHAPVLAIEEWGNVPLVGRVAELYRLTAAFDDVARRRRERVVLVTGEPGIGKSRLLAELVATVRAGGATVLQGSAYEAETGQPYGPWMDALGQVTAASVGGTLGNELALLMPVFGQATTGKASRDRLFGAVVDLIAAQAHGAPVVIAFDDVHWCDDASAALLHYVLRINRFRPLLVVLAAREGELPDNPSMQSALRALRREQLLDDWRLAPLGLDDTANLVRRLMPSIDADAVFAECRGNPLFAIEFARAAREGKSDLPNSLAGLIRDRVAKLPVSAALVLRWAAVLGQTFSVPRLQALLSAEPAELLNALEILERHGLIVADDGSRGSGDSYAFAHDLVRRAIYSDLSEPRRRLIHRRIAEALMAGVGSDESAAAEIVDHAALAGEMVIAARACVTAGRRCLRLFANTEAFAMARRGMRYAESLAEPDQLKLTLEAMEIALGARQPERPDETMRTLEALSERAMDHGCMEHARLGFHLLGYLRWEGGASSDAQREMLRARDGQPLSRRRRARRRDGGGRALPRPAGT